MEQHQAALGMDEAARVATAIDATIGFRTQRGPWGRTYREKLAREIVQTMGEFGYRVGSWDGGNVLLVSADTAALRFLRSAMDAGNFKKPVTAAKLAGAGR